jgi:hypothetical protein
MHGVVVDEAAAVVRQAVKVAARTATDNSANKERIFVFIVWF